MLAACSIDVDQQTQNTGHQKCYWNVERRTLLCPSIEVGVCERRRLVGSRQPDTLVPGRLNTERQDSVNVLHQLVSRLERALDQKQYALGVFDIEGAFDNSSPRSVRYALDEWRVVKTVRNWIINMIESLSIHICLGNSNMVVQVGTGTTGGGLSPTLWSLIADSLLKWLSKQGVYAQGFADDGVVVVI